MNRILRLGVVVCCIIGVVAAQKTVPPLPTDTLARVGGTVITARDLIERIELMPWEGKEKPKQHDSSKVKALNSLVAERLLAIEGKHLNVGTDPVSRIKITGMEKMFVRDELFNREVKQKVSVSEREINEGLTKFAWQLHIAAVKVKDHAAGDSLVAKLQKNIPFSKIIAADRWKTIISVETVQVNFGGLDTLFENTVYAIGKRKFSRPFISATYGWTVALLIDRGTNPVAEKMSLGDRRIRVEETIRSKKEDVAAGIYYAAILAPQKAMTDSAMFFTLANALRSIIMNDSAKHFNKGMYGVISEDVDQLLTMFISESERPFADVPERPVTFGEVIEGMRNLRFGFRSLEKNIFDHDLNYHLRTLIGKELIAREGYRQQLQHSESVQKDLQVWSNYWISRYLMWRVNDTVNVGNDDVYNVLLSVLPSIGKQYEVQIREVLCDSLTTAADVMSEYSRGTDLSVLADRYTKRMEWKKNGGLSPFLPLDRMPELTCRAFMADTGSTVGPVRTAAGYSFLKVIAKRSAGKTDVTPDSVIVNIRNNLNGKKRNSAMNAYVAELAKNYSIDIRYDRLNAVKIQPANMFTRRMIGFGGIITGAPMLYPNWEWMKNYRNGDSNLP